MRKSVVPWLVVILVLLPLATACRQQSSAPDLSQSSAEESADLQERGNGTVELVTEPVHHGTYSAKLAIPREYSFGDAARIAVPLDGMILDDITSMSYWCYIDPATPANQDGTYPVPYITFELDTDGQPGCDTWVIGGAPPFLNNSGVWFECILESDALFHVSSTRSDYTSPFPLSSMGTLAQIQAATGPDGKTPLGDCTVSKVRLAIGNWGPGGPPGPVICHVDCLTCNEEIRF